MDGGSIVCVLLLQEDKALYRQVAGLVGVFSPYGLFLSLLRKLLANPHADRPFVVTRICSSSSSSSSKSSSSSRRECSNWSEHQEVTYVVEETQEEADLRSWERRVERKGALRHLEDELNRMQALMHLLAAYSAIVGTTHNVIHAFVQPSTILGFRG